MNVFTRNKNIMYVEYIIFAMNFIEEKEDFEKIENSQIELEGESFLFMGCWNNGYCHTNKDKTNDLYKTVESIKTLLTILDRENIVKPQKLFIAGDNYYPDKIKVENDKKEKFTNIENLNSGFDCIKSININKYILFGNHDYEKTNLKNNDDITKEKECHNLMTQLEYNKNEMEFFDFYSYCLPHIYKNKTLIVMIDSTMYDIEKNDEALDCYKELYTNYDNDNMLEFIKNQQTQRANNLIDYYKDKNVKNIIFMAHHPIFGFKMKKDKLKNELYDGLIELEMLFYDTFQQTNQINYYHFCADIHQFQVSTITINNDFVIKQYIVGTGGAEKDARININYDNNSDNNHEIQKFHNNDNNKYNFEAELVLSLDLNGFMKCDIRNNKIHCSLWPNFVFENNKFNKEIYKFVNNIDFYNPSISHTLNKTNFFINQKSIGGKSRKKKNVKSKKNKIKRSKKNHKNITKKRNI